MPIIAPTTSRTQPASAPVSSQHDFPKHSFSRVFDSKRGIAGDTSKMRSSGNVGIGIGENLTSRPSPSPTLSLRAASTSSSAKSPRTSDTIVPISLLSIPRNRPFAVSLMHTHSSCQGDGSDAARTLFSWRIVFFFPAAMESGDIVVKL